MKITEFLKNPNYNPTEIETKKGVYSVKFDKGIIFKIEDYFEMKIVKRKHSEITLFDLNYKDDQHKFDDIFSIVEEINNHFEVRYCIIEDTLKFKNIKANIYWGLSKGKFLYEEFDFKPYQPRIFLSYHKEYLRSISYYYNDYVKDFYNEIKKLKFTQFIETIKEKYKFVKDHESINLLHRLQDLQVEKVYKIYGENETKIGDFIRYIDGKKNTTSMKIFYDIMYETLFLGDLIPTIFIKIY